MDNTTNLSIVIKDTINTILNSLFSSINSNIYEILDDITFISSDILSDVNFEKILGKNTNSGILLICNSLIFGFILYYAIKHLLAHITCSNSEIPQKFVFKIILLGIFANCSYFLIELLLDIFSNITLSIRAIGEDIFHKNICFSQLIIELNSTFSPIVSDTNIFSLEGLLTTILTLSLLNLVFTYSFRYVMLKIFILLTPFSILSLSISSTSWFFKAWIRNLFSLLFIQIIVSLVLLLLFSMDFSSNNMLIKFIYIGAIYALIKSDSFVRDFIGGVSTTFTQNVGNLFKF